MAGRYFHFSHFTLDLDRMALLDGAEQVELRPKAFDTLVALVERSGRVVSKDDLVAIVWPDVTVNDDALAQCVRDIRKAIGDADQKVVKTVPRRGYMFTASVDFGEGVAGAAQTDKGRRGKLAMLAAGLAALAMAIAVILWNYSSAPTTAALFARTPQATVAVLPFDAGGDTGETAWLGEGLADEVILTMSQFRDLAVIARTSSFGYRDADLATIRDTLGADFAVQGSVRRNGDHLRLAVQLVDLQTGVNRWANRFERPYADLPLVLEEMSMELVSALVAQARDAVAERTAHGTALLSVYELTMKARRALLMFEPHQTFEALRLVERALEVDPNYAVAWDLLAQIRVQFFIQPYDEQSGNPATLVLAREAAVKAVSLDPAYSTARATLAGLLARQGDYEGSLEMLRQALELNPNDATALSTYADILDRSGDHGASLAAWNALARVDPAGPILRLALTSRAQMFSGDLEGALASARACEARGPQFQPCLVFLAIAAAAIGDEDAARHAGQRLLEVNPRFTIAGHFQVIPFRRSEDILLMRQHLLAAGLPETD